jgi:hypothetical protein
LYNAPPDIPLSLGDLIGRSFRVFRDQFRLVWTAIAWPTILATLSVAGMRWSVVHFLTSHAYDLPSIILHSVALLLCLCLLGVAQWELAIRSVSIVRVVLAIDADYKSANPYARRRKWAALLLYSLAAVAPLIVLIFWTVLIVAFVVNSKGMPFASLISFFFFAIVGLLFTCTVSWSLLGSALSFTVLACEDCDLNTVFPRTYQLMKNYLWRGGSFVVLLTFTLFAVTGALDLPLLVISLFDAWRNNLASDFDPPMYLEILSAFVDGIVNIVLLSVAPIANALYYNDLLLRMEGRDIVMRLEKLERSESVSG